MKMLLMVVTDDELEDVLVLPIVVLIGDGSKACMFCSLLISVTTRIFKF